MKRTGILLAVLLTCGAACRQAPVVTPCEGPWRVVTFGDSNTDHGWRGAETVDSGYLDARGGLPANGPNSPYQLAGMIESLDRRIRAVNHGIGGTRSGIGRNAVVGSPNAREAVAGVTRFEAEVLGRGYPWSGGEPTPIVRVQAFVPGRNDFAYVSFGTGDKDATATAANLRYMIGAWRHAGHRADHFLLTTLAPATTSPVIPETNREIRRLARETGVRLIDLAAHTSMDDGATWQNSEMHTGDGVHYVEVVRRWLAARVVAIVTASPCR